MGWTSPTIYRVDTQGNLIDTILVKEGAGGGLTWDGEDFWAPGGVGIVKINIEGGDRWIYLCGERGNLGSSLGRELPLGNSKNK